MTTNKDISEIYNKIHDLDFIMKTEIEKDGYHPLLSVFDDNIKDLIDIYNKREIQITDKCEKIDDKNYVSDELFDNILKLLDSLRVYYNDKLDLDALLHTLSSHRCKFSKIKQELKEDKNKLNDILERENEILSDMVEILSNKTLKEYREIFDLFINENLTNNIYYDLLKDVFIYKFKDIEYILNEIERSRNEHRKKYEINTCMRDKEVNVRDGLVNRCS